MANTSSGELLRISREFTDDGVLVRVAGDLDMATAGKLAEELRIARELGAASAPLIVLLDEVDFLGSAGLAVLVHESNGLRIVASSRLVLHSIAATGLAEVLPVFPTVEDALARTAA
ncbi:anti-sigma factor antagonist [Amycolatopsis pithecellobii]|uniref:Anti-sigma factor antagonist n=1 Tax=Amycolatopsis pithecellobii TaxID=664692 RepID=A0A6N7YKD7_9PSEU|nr:anti-sigma factor antagonist [Amycolatopsis pithecellobii]MTD53375.1 anti-sigma factor antagonist [Amycolatopsis pithecellobii]